MENLFNYGSQFYETSDELVISDETRIIHTKSDDIEIMIGSETDKITEELFNSHLQRYQNKFRRINETKWFFLRQCWSVVL